MCNALRGLWPCPHTTLNSRKGKCPSVTAGLCGYEVRLCTHMGLRLIHWGSVAMWLVGVMKAERDGATWGPNMG